MTPRFDAYTATTTAIKAPEVVAWFFEGRSDCTMRQGRGLHTFGERISVVDHSGVEVGSVSWGGKQGERIMIEAKGEGTPAIVDKLRQGVPHRVTRADSCVDFERPGVFDELLGHVEAIKREHRLYGSRAGDWDDHPELGRSRYLGAPSSPIRSRLYEKGKQPEYRHLARFDLVRLELQVRPQKDAKHEYASLDALQVWGASKWTRDLAARVLAAHLGAHPAGTVRRDSTRDRALRFMAGQYGQHLTSLAADLGGWDVLGLTLREMVTEADDLKKRLKAMKSRH